MDVNHAEKPYLMIKKKVLMRTGRFELPLIGLEPIVITGLHYAP